MPVCPLCNCPVSLGTTGALPDEVVGRHIDNDCQSETAQSRRKVCMHLTHFFSCLTLLVQAYPDCLGKDAFKQMSISLSVVSQHLFIADVKFRRLHVVYAVNLFKHPG